MNLCVIKEAGPTCLQNTDDQTDVGWCYVDPANDPTASSVLVEKCPANERRILRFVDPHGNTPIHGGTVLIACLGADLSEEP